MEDENDISNHKFTSLDIKCAFRVMGDMVLIDHYDGHLQLSKSDVIALAKHYNLTYGDLWKYQLGNQSSEKKS